MDGSGIADPVADWVRENPGDFSGADPAVRHESADLPPVTDDAAQAGAPAAADPIAPAATADANAPAAATPDKPGEPKAAADAPAAPTPTPAATAAPKVYDPAEKIALGEGTEWTRAQIIEGLQERGRLLPEATQAKAFRDLFDNQTPEQVRANFDPLFTAIRSNPDAARFAEGVLFGTDAARLEYLQQCAAAYDDVTPPAAAAPPAARVPTFGQPQPAAPQQTERDKQIADLVAWKNGRERQDGIDRVNREWAEATTRYPILATDANLRRLVGARASQLFDANQQHGLIEALGEFRSLIEATQIASAQAAPPPAAAPVPALLGGAGASPTASGPAAVKSEAKVDLNNVVEDWLANESPKFR